MTPATPALMEAAKEYYEAYSQVFGFDHPRLGYRRARWDELGEGMQRSYAAATAQFLRWELTREPSEGMVAEAQAAEIDYRQNKRSGYLFAHTHRAMSRARLQELGGKE